MPIIEFDHPYIPGGSNSTTGPTLEGKVGFYSGNAGTDWMQERFGNKPALCLKLRGSWSWVPLSLVSANKFKTYRENIESHYGLLYQKYLGGKKRIKKLKENARENADEALMAHLWSSYDPRIQRELMQEILNQFPTSTFSKKTCSVCLKFAPTKLKCMHIDCFEMCMECHKQSFGTELDPIDCESCPSCKKEQKSTCPICLGDKKNDELIYGDNCSHSICCKCFCSSFSSTPIVDCPLCRKNFKKTHWRTRNQNPNN